MMALTTEEFVRAFHSIKGSTVAEKKKNLFQLLNDNVNLKINCSQITPTTPLEEIFKTDVIIFFKDNDELLELLYDENPKAIEKILKVEWFVKDTFENVSGEDLASNIFPKLSFNAKLKLLTRLALVIPNSAKCDEFFHSLKKSYGIYLAAKLLPGCSKNVILDALETRVELSPKQLLIIIKRNPSITQKIFDKLNSYSSNSNLGEKYKYVFQYLMKTDLSVLIDCHDKYNFNFKLGKRATCRFIVENKEFFIKHSHKLYRLLKGSEIQAGLSGDFKAVFSELFPQSMDYLLDNFDEYLSLLNSLSNQDKIDLLFSTFKKHYDTELLEYPQFQIPKIFQWMSPSFRENWIESHEKPVDMSEEHWISYMKTDKSIPLIKKKFSHTSNIIDRENLMAALVQTCKINNDLTALTNVCEYVAAKHRNDHSTVRIKFLETIKKCFALKKLNQDQWKNINVIIQRCVLNNESNWLWEPFITDFIYFSLENSLSITEHLKLWTKVTYGNYNIVSIKPEYEKQCLDAFYKIIPLCFKDKQLEDQYIYFLSSVSEWNKRNRNDKFSLFNYTHAIDALRKKLEEGNMGYQVDRVAMDCINADKEKACEIGIPELLISQKHYHSIDVAQLVNNYPTIILTHIKEFIEKVCSAYLSMSTLCKIFQNLVCPNLKEKIATFCIEEKCKVNETYDKQRFAMYILSFILTNQEFVKVVEKFYPQDSEANVENAENQLIYKLQQAILPCFRHFLQPYTALEPVLNFCKGDYMQFAQKSLYHIVENVAEYRLVEYLHKLSDRAVSVRKHSIYLSCKLLNKETTFASLKAFMDNEKNPSIRKILFNSVFNYFLKSPDDYTWSLVKENIKEIHTDDTEAFRKIVVKSSKVPKQFFAAYVLFVWQSLNKLQPVKEIEENKCKIIDSITEEFITLLPEDFCMVLIRTHLFKSNSDKFEETINMFVSRYILYSKNDNLSEIFSMIKSNFQISSRSIYKFIQELVKCFIKGKCEKKSIFNDFVSLWKGQIKPYEALEEYLYLNLSLILSNHKEQKEIAECGKEIAKMFITLSREKCEDVYTLRSIFQDTFKDQFLADLKGSVEQNYIILVYNIIKYDQDDTNNDSLRLGLSLLPTKIPEVPKIKSMYDSIVEIATKNVNPYVQIQLHNHLINIEIINRKPSMHLGI